MTLDSIVIISFAIVTDMVFDGAVGHKDDDER